jgi:hypothetical protein
MVSGSILSGAAVLSRFNFLRGYGSQVSSYGVTHRGIGEHSDKRKEASHLLLKMRRVGSDLKWLS